VEASFEQGVTSTLDFVHRTYEKTLNAPPQNPKPKRGKTMSQKKSSKITKRAAELIQSLANRVAG